jgi:hypothetical protein
MKIKNVLVIKGRNSHNPPPAIAIAGAEGELDPLLPLAPVLIE